MAFRINVAAISVTNSAIAQKMTAALYRTSADRCSTAGTVFIAARDGVTFAMRLPEGTGSFGTTCCGAVIVRE
jgi:cytochrome c5